MTTFSETRRQVVHMAMGGFALLLRALTWWEAALLAGAALIFNAVVLPRLGGRTLYRPIDVTRGISIGIILYPLAVLLLIVAFPRRPDIAAAAWGVLAVGDGSATLVGHAMRGSPLPWNRNKTIAGTVMFFVAGSVAGVLLALWVRPAITPVASARVRPRGARGRAAAARTRRNHSSQTRRQHQRPCRGGRRAVVREPRVWRRMVVGMAGRGRCSRARSRRQRDHGVARLAAACGFAVWRHRRRATRVCRLRMHRARRMVASLRDLRRRFLDVTTGIPTQGATGHRRGTRRSSRRRERPDKLRVAAASAILAAASPSPQTALLAMVAAFTAAGSDTVASEIGKAWGRHTFLVTGFTRTQPGTPGAISFEGTAAGLVGALSLAALAQAGGLIPSAFIRIVVVGATFGSLVESALGATVEAPGTLTNDLLNFINTAAAAVCAVTLAGLTS